MFFFELIPLSRIAALLIASFVSGSERYQTGECMIRHVKSRIELQHVEIGIVVLDPKGRYQELQFEIRRSLASWFV